MSLARGTQEYFLLNSVIMTNDHIINKVAKDRLSAELNELFMKGLLGQYKLQENIIGGAQATGSDDQATGADDIEYNFYE